MPRRPISFSCPTVIDWGQYLYMQDAHVQVSPVTFEDVSVGLRY